MDTTDIVEPAINIIINSSLNKFALTIVNTKIKHNLSENYLLCFWNNQWHILPDNGIASILSNHDEIQLFAIPIQIGKFVNFTEDIVHNTINHLIDSNFNPKEVKFTKSTEIVRGELVLPSNSNNRIKLNVVYIDVNGDVYLNMIKTEFDNLVGNKKFKLRLTFSFSIDNISTHYSQVAPGETIAFFHSSNLLCLKQHHGSAQKAFGLNKDKQLILQLEEFN